MPGSIGIIFLKLKINAQFRNFNYFPFGKEIKTLPDEVYYIRIREIRENVGEFYLAKFIKLNHRVAFYKMLRK